MFVQSFVAQAKKREEEIKTNAKTFQKKYGIKHCPFHTPSLAKNVKPYGEIVDINGSPYKFHLVSCSSWKMCDSPVSFRKSLTKRLSEIPNMKEIKLERRSRCITCGDSEGIAYDTGLRHGMNRNKPVYLFLRNCGHNYAAALSFTATALPLK